LALELVEPAHLVFVLPRFMQQSFQLLAK